MEWIPLVLIGVSSVLGTWLVVYGVFGGPAFDRPVCVRCRSDARPAAWRDPMRCGCGAALDRPGAVRTKGRRRRPKTAILGALVWCAAGGAAFETHRLESLGRTWLDYVPQTLLVQQAAAGRAWAIDLAAERIDPASTSPEEALDLLVGVPWGQTHLTMMSALHDRWTTSRPNLESAFDRGAGFAVTPVETGETTPVYRLSINERITQGWFGRVERVSIGGRDADWRLAPSEERWVWQHGRMAFVGAVQLVVVPPEGLDRSVAHSISIDLELLHSAYPAALATHPGMNAKERDPNPPIRVAGFRRTFVVELPPIVPDDATKERP
jgi:hypothetical protein